MPRSIITGPWRRDAGDADNLRRRRDQRLASIREDFALVAQCNLGGEFMSDDKVERLRRIASQTWLRHLDDRIGLSQEESGRKDREPEKELPVVEPLLADKTEHLVYRTDGGHPFGDNSHGFKMAVPEHMYNHGEIYNLTIPRGTLTPEERFKIQRPHRSDHKNAEKLAPATGSSAGAGLGRQSPRGLLRPRVSPRSCRQCAFDTRAHHGRGRRV